MGDAEHMGTMEDPPSTLLVSPGAIQVDAVLHRLCKNMFCTYDARRKSLAHALLQESSSQGRSRCPVRYRACSTAPVPRHMHNRRLPWTSNCLCTGGSHFHALVCGARAEESMFVRHTFSGDVKKTTKLALFDLDDTLIESPGHQKENGARWVFLHGNVAERLRELDRSGFFVGIVSNQCGLEAFKETFVEMLDEFLSRFGFPVFFIATTKNDFFRKPLPGSYEYLRHKYFRRVDPISFYVGDAAGRCTSARRDHSCCDIKFAYNCGLRFFTPEAFFGGEPNTTTFTVFNPFLHTSPVKLGDPRDVVVVFGKGRLSGKKFFLQKNFSGHQPVHRGVLKTRSQRKAFTDVQRFDELGHLVKTYGSHNIQCVFLDYEPHVLHYIKTFSKLTGKQSMYIHRSHEFRSLLCLRGGSGREALKALFFKRFGVGLTIADFCFDDSGYDSIERTVSRFQL